ncbi:AP-1 complex subunit sigma-2 [Diplonema papillatum]|nr:AP-1 complex subunit sigma-2 [Diplonema papillatum]
MIQFILLISRQGKVRLAKWYTPFSGKDKSKAVREISNMVIGRMGKLCNFLEWRDYKIVWRRYASLYFVAGIDKTDNELISLEIVHHFVESLDRYFGHVCEFDLIFNFQKAYYILDEVILAGELQESSKRTVIKLFNQQEILLDTEKAET